ncbi:MAG: hypothetical protein NXI22_04705 [bacterium]|nr:hypothetical protein [bacterium]
MALNRTASGPCVSTSDPATEVVPSQSRSIILDQLPGNTPAEMHGFVTK